MPSHRNKEHRSKDHRSKDHRHSGAARISVFGFLLASATNVHAQTTLHGRVLDPLGAAVPNATVSLMNSHNSSGLDEGELNAGMSE